MSSNNGFDDLNDFNNSDSGAGKEDDSTFSNLSDDFGDFETSQPSGSGNNDSNNGDNKHPLAKFVIVIVVAGILVGLGTFVVMSNRKGNNAAKATPSVVPTNQATQSAESTTQKAQPTPTSSNTQQSSVTNSNAGKDDWTELNKESKISFGTKYVNTTFTVVGIKHYVKIVNGNNDFMIKTIVTGSLNGYIGTYDLEIPYSKGSQLSAGDSFSVKVQVGEYNNKVVVGDIQY